MAGKRTAANSKAEQLRLLLAEMGEDEIRDTFSSDLGTLLKVKRLEKDALSTFSDEDKEKHLTEALMPIQHERGQLEAEKAKIQKRLSELVSEENAVRKEFGGEVSNGSGKVEVLSKKYWNAAITEAAVLDVIHALQSNAASTQNNIKTAFGIGRNTKKKPHDEATAARAAMLAKILTGMRDSGAIHVGGGAAAGMWFEDESA